jgi:hypothetical protein
MLQDLKVVDGIQLTFVMDNNQTSDIEKLIDEMEYTIPQFSNYKIIIQLTFNFHDYAYYREPFWYYPIECFSQQFYNNLYGNITQLLANYDNIKLFVGFNEPYYHLENKEDAQTIMIREYTTWKSFNSSIPFSNELPLPYIFWAEYWGKPENPSVSNDYAPYWKDYSDFIGTNLWADAYNIYYGKDPEGDERAKTCLSIMESYSKEYNKPIHVNEFPTWDKERTKYIADNFMHEPNIFIVYRLWQWKDLEELTDSWVYGLYNIDTETNQISRVEPTWYIFRDVFNPLPQDITQQNLIKMATILIILAVLGVIYRNVV